MLFQTLFSGLGFCHLQNEVLESHGMSMQALQAPFFCFL